MPRARRLLRVRRVRRLVLLATAVVLAAAPSPAGAQEPAITLEEAHREDGRLHFTVFAPGGPLLSSDDFAVSVNDLPAEEVVAVPGTGVRRPAGAVLVIDTSGSMVGAPIEEAKRAIRTFARTVNPDDDLALVGFSDEPRVLAEFDDSRSRLVRAASALKASGETALQDAVVEAVGLVGDRPKEQRNIILLSDGADTASSASLDRAVTSARDAGATVFIVGLESPEYAVGDIRSLASETGGRVLVTSDSSDLTALFARLADTLVSRYEISVRNPDPVATQLAVEVSVAGETRTRGSETFTFDAPTVETQESVIGRIPLPVLLAIVFLAIGLCVLFASEVIRSGRNKPADRILWYDEKGEEHIEQDALINAAILERAKDLATRVAAGTGLLDRLDRDVDAAGLRWKPGEVIVAAVLMGLCGLGLGWALSGPAISLLVGVIGLLAPFAWIKLKATRRRRAFGAQLPDVQLLMSGGLRAGYSLQQALGAVGEDARPPASEEFRRAMAEVRLGSTIDQALRDLARRIDLVDFDWTVMAIEIQREVGGNLAEILETIADTIRSRHRLHRTIRALTAEGRLSGWILGGLPFFLTGMLLTINPDYLEPLYTTSLGLMMVAGAVFGMIVGGLWMRKIIKIEV